MGTKANPGEFDCYAKAAPDEPIFVIRAKDPKACQTVSHWMINSIDTQPIEKIQAALECLYEMKAWRRKQGLDNKPRLEMRDFV